MAVIIHKLSSHTYNIWSAYNRLKLFFLNALFSVQIYFKNAIRKQTNDKYLTLFLTMFTYRSSSLCRLRTVIKNKNINASTCTTDVFLGLEFRNKKKLKFWRRSVKEREQLRNKNLLSAWQVLQRKGYQFSWSSNII